MNTNIEAIFLDVGNTLRIVIPDQEFMCQAKKELMALVGATEPEAEFFQMLESRWLVYRKQSKASLLEACERDLWTKWLLPDYPAEKIAPLAGSSIRIIIPNPAACVPSTSRTGLSPT